MDMKKVFYEGISFEVFVKNGEGSHIEKTLDLLHSIQFEENIVSRIKAIDKKINILTLAEIWCPDCMINVPVLQKMKKYNDNIEFSIIKREGNEKYFKKYSVDGKIKIPTFIVFDDDFNEIGYFIERPKIIKDIYKSDNQVDIIIATKKYRNGQYGNETARDILDMLNY